LELAAAPCRFHFGPAVKIVWNLDASFHGGTHPVTSGSLPARGPENRPERNAGKPRRSWNTSLIAGIPAISPSPVAASALFLA
jgi:hypothetical protein